MGGNERQDIRGDALAFLATMRQSAIYAGTFDPITLGHLDLIERASQIFDSVVIAVAEHPRKITAFGIEERCDMVGEACAAFPRMEVTPFSGLLVDFARKSGIHVLIRGLRAYSDFESEFQMALINRKLSPDIETLFMMPQEAYSCLSSSVVREVAALGGDIRSFVPLCVAARIQKHLGKRTDA